MTSIDKFIKAIENEEFIEGHELLEHDWKAYKKEGEKQKAKALQGLINGATALALLIIKKRPEGYKKVWPVFLKYEHLLDIATLPEIEKFHQAKEILHIKNKKYN